MPAAFYTKNNKSLTKTLMRNVSTENNKKIKKQVAKK